MITPLLGTSFIGYSRSTGTETCGNGIQPGTGTIAGARLLSATPEEVERAMALASAAFPDLLESIRKSPRRIPARHRHRDRRRRG